MGSGCAADGVGEIVQQMRVGADEAVPDVEDGFDLILHDIVGAAQGGNVVVAQQQGFA